MELDSGQLFRPLDPTSDLLFEAGPPCAKIFLVTLLEITVLYISLVYKKEGAQWLV
jgi:hypothetical protein